MYYKIFVQGQKTAIRIRALGNRINQGMTVTISLDDLNYFFSADLFQFPAKHSRKQYVFIIECVCDVIKLSPLHVESFVTSVELKLRMKRKLIGMNQRGVHAKEIVKNPDQPVNLLSLVPLVSCVCVDICTTATIDGYCNGQARAVRYALPSNVSSHCACVTYPNLTLVT